MREFRRRGHRPALSYMDAPARRLVTLRAALGFLGVPPTEPGLGLLHRWLDTWTGLGLIAAGMHRTGWDLQLTEYGDGHWRATFYVTGIGVGTSAVDGGTAGGLGGGQGRS